MAARGRWPRVNSQNPIYDPGLTGPGDPWYGPTDMQVVTAIQALGLDVFPFGAYDAYGRLKVDPKVTDELRRELRDVLEQPVWTDLFKALSLFDNPGHEAFALGFAADRRGVRILVFRQLALSSNPKGCADWHGALAEQLLANVQAAAGKHHYVNPRWLEVIRKVLSLIGGGDNGDKPEPDPETVTSAIGWKVALEIVLGILEVANSIGRSPNVNCTVVWRYPTWLRLPKGDVQTWSPISTVASSGRTKWCTGVLWDRPGRQVWHWADRQPWPIGFPFTPRGLWRSLYPSGKLLQAGILDDSSAGKSWSSQPGDRSLSRAGLQFIARWEGFRGRLYNDALGHCTIGYGHLVHRGKCNGSEPPNFRKGITEAEGRKLLKSDAQQAVNGVSRLIRVALSQTQFDALASFTFNVGVGALETSTLRRLLNQGDYKSVPGQMSRWTNGGLPGLVNRRRAEGSLFAHGRYSAQSA